MKTENERILELTLNVAENEKNEDGVRRCALYRAAEQCGELMRSNNPQHLAVAWGYVFRIGMLMAQPFCEAMRSPIQQLKVIFDDGMEKVDRLLEVALDGKSL